MIPPDTMANYQDFYFAGHGESTSSCASPVATWDEVLRASDDPHDFVDKLFRYADHLKSTQGRQIDEGYLARFRQSLERRLVALKATHEAELAATVRSIKPDVTLVGGSAVRTLDPMARGFPPLAGASLAYWLAARVETLAGGLKTMRAAVATLIGGATPSPGLDALLELLAAYVARVRRLLGDGMAVIIPAFTSDLGRILTAGGQTGRFAPLN